MSLMLGNLNVKEMQRRSGVEFPTKLLDCMKDCHQSDANNIAPGKWHCFDIPFLLLCGDIETATKIHQHLEPFSKQFKERLQISVQRNKK